MISTSNGADSVSRATKLFTVRGEPAASVSDRFSTEAGYRALRAVPTTARRGPGLRRGALYRRCRKPNAIVGNQRLPCALTPTMLRAPLIHGGAEVVAPRRSTPSRTMEI